MWLYNSSTGVFASASTFTGNVTVNDSARATMSGSVTGTVTTEEDSHASIDGSVTGNVQVWHSSSVVVDGTVDGNLEIGTGSTLNRLGVTGVIDGNCQLSTGDRLVVAGTVTNGLFSCNQTSVTVIESTAKIYSTGNNCWLYNSTTVTWMVGEDGTVGTIWADRDTNGDYGDEVRYALVGQTFKVDFTDYDVATYGTTLDVKLVSDIEQENNFETSVTFWSSAVEHTDVTYLGDGVFRINNIPIPVTGSNGTVFVVK